MNASNKILDLIPDGRSAWSRGVKDYAADLLGSLRDDQPITKQNLLNGANDWNHWAYGGCGMIYDADIAERLCSPSELKRKKGGDLAPNSLESWLDVEARAASQACRAILRAVAKLNANFDQPELIAWAKNAKHGEKFGGGAGGSAECIDIARTAHDIIEAIAADLGLDASALTAEDRRRIRYGLEDGAALAYLGLGDADQDAVEEAHAAMVEIIEDAELSEAPGAPTEVYGGYVWMIGADEFRWSKRATERECRLAVLHAIRLHGVDGAFDLDA